MNPQNQFSLVGYVSDPQYAGVSDVQFASGNEIAVDWSDDDFQKVRKWNVPKLNTNEVITDGAAWYRAIRDNRISLQTAIYGLRLALSLRSMNPSANNEIKYLLEQQDRATIAGSQPDTPFPGLASFSNVNLAITLEAENMLLPVNVEPAGGVIRSGGGGGGGHPNPAAVDDTIHDFPAEGEAAVKEAGANAYTFLAFYCMRLLGKHYDNLVNSIDNMKERYTQFYGPHRLVQQFTITRQAAANYRAALTNNPMIQSTYVHSLAYTQSFLATPYIQNEFGVLNYGGFLPLSYMGVHAYTLMMQVSVHASCPINMLLSLCDISVTHVAVRKIYDVLIRFERIGGHLDRSPAFRYAAHFGPSYFGTLRTRSCPQLVYILACIHNTLVAATAASDPERIRGADNLSVQMKAILKSGGTMIGNALLARMVSGGVQANSVWNMAINMHNVTRPVGAAIADEELEGVL